MVSAGIGDDGRPHGTFRYLEVKGRPRLENAVITKYEVVGGMTRRLEGTGTWQGSPVTWVATLSDADGNGTDVFTIEMSNGYQAGGSIVQGDITVHPAPIDCNQILNPAGGRNGRPPSDNPRARSPGGLSHPRAHAPALAVTSAG